MLKRANLILYFSLLLAIILLWVIRIGIILKAWWGLGRLPVSEDYLNITVWTNYHFVLFSHRLDEFWVALISIFAFPLWYVSAVFLYIQYPAQRKWIIGLGLFFLSLSFLYRSTETARFVGLIIT
ncbi:MAG: hypothetical protein R2795_08580 [Saprospiraceae bacterium]